MSHAIFEDWEDYDNLKKKGEDKNIFSCTEKWEVRYLREKIKKHFPTLPAKDVMNSIEHCCHTASPPHPRKAFVAYVMSQLGIKIN